MQKPRNFPGAAPPDHHRSSLGGATRHLAHTRFWWEIARATRAANKAIVIKVLQNKSQQNDNGVVSVTSLNLIRFNKLCKQSSLDLPCLDLTCLSVYRAW